MNHTNEPKTQDARPQVDEQRRRLTKSGLAAPIVLGTLLSRPVLGAAPYHCTVSGQISGNISPRPGTGTACSSLGKPPSYWDDSTGAVFAGTGILTTAPFTSISFVDTYWKENGANGLLVKSTTTPGNSASTATLREVLTISPDSNNPPTNLALGRAAIASYLNAIAYAADYPLTTAQVVAMFNATINGGTYPVGSGWDAGKVLSYFESLYQ